MRRETNSFLIILTFAFSIMLACIISTASVVIFGQKNQINTGASSSSGNQTTANVRPAGKQG